MSENLLYYGDNLDILRRYTKDRTVDLVYLDPPFNSNVTYNVLFGEQNGARAAAQIKAFEDTWRWDEAAAEAYREVVEAGGKVSEAMQAFRGLLRESNMLAYLAMMAPRLVELRRVLKPTGTIYLHCDPTASHYLKVLMDAVFDTRNYLNEIVWCYETGGRATRSFPKKHDIILRYGRTAEAAFYYDQVALARDFTTMHEPVLTDEQGGKYQRNIKEGREYRYYVDKGVLPNDWWADIQALNPAAKERLGYPTQKPEGLLQRIILASSKEGDMVLDPFCGCGTTVVVAQRLGRRWIGIDITHLAVTLMRHRLTDSFGGEVTYDVIGEPVSLPDARALAEQDRYQFQWWALGLVGARPVEGKKGSDKGIDGRLYFHDEAEGGDTKQVVLSVKAGTTGVAHVRDLRGVVEREKAEIGVLISMEEPSRPMRSEAASAGFYEPPGRPKGLEGYPRLQTLTIADLLGGKGIAMPRGQLSVTFRKAPRAKGEGPEQLALEE